MIHLFSQAGDLVFKLLAAFARFLDLLLEYFDPLNQFSNDGGGSVHTTAAVILSIA